MYVARPWPRFGASRVLLEVRRVELTGRVVELELKNFARILLGQYVAPVLAQLRVWCSWHARFILYRLAIFQIFEKKKR